MAMHVLLQRDGRMDQQVSSTLTSPLALTASEFLPDCFSATSCPCFLFRRDVSKTDVVRDLHRLAPFLTIIVKANSSTVKAGEPCTEKAQNSGGRKGQETLAYRIVVRLGRSDHTVGFTADCSRWSVSALVCIVQSLFHQSFRCLRSVQGFGRQGSHLCDFFYAMLAPQNRSKVQDHLPSGATVISLDKLLNWCIGMLETHTKALVDKRMFAEAAQALDTLMLLAPALKFGEERHRQLIIQKRMAWTGHNTRQKTHTEVWTSGGCIVDWRGCCAVCQVSCAPAAWRILL